MDTNETKSMLSDLTIFKVGEVVSVNGREVVVKVDKDKNVSHLVYKGEVIKNVAVGGYVKITKGYTRFVGSIESEHIDENKKVDSDYYSKSDLLVRTLIVKLTGYIENGEYKQGIKELPLLGNECFLMDKEEFDMVHRFAKIDEKAIELGTLLRDDRIPVKLSISKLFSNHIGIFGNTGSGKSYTLARLFSKLYELMKDQKSFQDSARFLLFDFNGEYSSEGSITKDKKVYNLSTGVNAKDKIPLRNFDIEDDELISILSNATEKTQRPFIKRALKLLSHIRSHDYDQQILSHFQNILKQKIERVLKMEDGPKAFLLIDYIEDIFNLSIKNFENNSDIRNDVAFHSKNHVFYVKVGGQDKYFNDPNNFQYIQGLAIYRKVDNVKLPDNYISQIICFMYLQLIEDVLNNRANNEHIAPTINKLKSTQKDFEKIFEVNNEKDFWDGKNFVVINLNEANTSSKKLVPMLLSTKLYSEHKAKKNGETKSSLNIIIDEAHNILSYESNRESETWKDYRLETFEEIIKEGRKFGVFMTIASQRPSDISPTIISQLHNYFIHRLVNDNDLRMVANNISYLDKVSLEMLPILPQGGCVIAGLMTHLPILVKVGNLSDKVQPQSTTMDISKYWFDSDKV